MKYKLFSNGFAVTTLIAGGVIFSLMTIAVVGTVVVVNNNNTINTARDELTGDMHSTMNRISEDVRNSLDAIKEVLTYLAQQNGTLSAGIETINSRLEKLKEV